MDNREKLYSGLSKAAWGYFLLNFDINLGTVSILPRFAGFFMLCSALGYLAEEQRDLTLLCPLGRLLAVWNLADWLLSWFGTHLTGKLLFLDLLITAAGLYFHFQFLTDMAALAEKLQQPDSGLDCRLRHRRTLYLVLTTLITIVSYLPLPAADVKSWLILSLGLIACVVSLMVMFALFGLRRCVSAADDPP